MVPAVAHLRDSADGTGNLKQPQPPSLLLFQTAEQQYALPLHEVETILPFAQLSDVPHAPAILTGFLNLAGEAVPVIRLSRLFGQADVPPRRDTPLVLMRPPRRWALWVEAIQRIVAPAEYTLAPLPAGTSLNDCAMGLVKLESHTALQLSRERLLLEQEARTLEALVAVQQARLREWEGLPM